MGLHREQHGRRLQRHLAVLVRNELFIVQRRTRLRMERAFLHLHGRADLPVRRRVPNGLSLFANARLFVGWRFLRGDAVSVPHARTEPVRFGSWLYVGDVMERARRFLVLTLTALALSLPAVTLAQPTLLAAVDELMTRGEYGAALALLEHTAGTVPELAARRAICESHLGRPDLVAAHAAIALSTPTDTWVSAHRAELELALTSTSAQNASPPPTPSNAESSAEVGSEPESGAIDGDFVQHFASSGVADEPLRARTRAMPDSRVVLRGFGGAGLQISTYSRMPYVESAESMRIETGARVSPTFAIGVQGEILLGARASLVGDVAFRTVPAMIGEGGFLVVSSQNAGRVDESFALFDWSAGYGMDLATTFRVISLRSPVFVGFGLRYGFVRSRAKSTLTDPSWDTDGNAPGTAEGTVKAVIGGYTVAGVFDVGIRIGRRDMRLTWRSTSGVPIFSTELSFAVPFWGGLR